MGLETKENVPNCETFLSDFEASVLIAEDWSLHKCLYKYIKSL